MNHRQFESQLADGYDLRASQYRQDDEIEVRSENHRRLGANLRRICGSFSHPIRVLEIGCGTGRYFHWLENVTLLIGTDLSARMLAHAKKPVNADRVTVADIRLLQGNIYEMTFDAGSFDFIYSLGMFGYGASMTAELSRKLHSWLAAGGRLYFDAIEKPSTAGLPVLARLKHHARYDVLPRLPSSLQQRLSGRGSGVPVFRHSREAIAAAMTSAGFKDLEIMSMGCQSPLWNGVHVECLARKEPAQLL
jgi:SAM-dependent methyltransferase